MNDIPWSMLFHIRLESLFILTLGVCALGVLEDLIKRRVSETEMGLIQAALPFPLILGFLYCLVAYNVYSLDILKALCGIGMLAAALHYATRCVRMDSVEYRRFGQFWCFVIVGLMLWFFLASLEIWLSDRYADFAIPGYVHLTLYIAAAVTLEWVLRKLELPVCRRERFRNIQCIHCGYSLNGSMNATRCPECGGEIKPQQSAEKTDS